MLKRHFCVIQRDILDLFQTGPSMKKLHDDVVKASNLFVCSVSDKQEKKFYNFDICGLYYKTFRTVIYDRNDMSQYYKTTIVDYDRS